MGADVDAGHVDLTTVGPEKRGDRAHERGLTGAVGPEQRGDLPGLGYEVEPVEGSDLAEALG